MKGNSNLSRVIWLWNPLGLNEILNYLVIRAQGATALFIK